MMASVARLLARVRRPCHLPSEELQRAQLATDGLRHLPAGTSEAPAPWTGTHPADFTNLRTNNGAYRGSDGGSLLQPKRTNIVSNKGPAIARSPPPGPGILPFSGALGSPRFFSRSQAGCAQAGSGGAAVSKEIDKILVANRGEIACRVMRTARRLGIQTVAVYSDADANALHVMSADEAVRIGPALASQSYLRQEAILEAALRTGAQAVHPGYGFLSENAEFAECCTEAGIEFMGPPAGAIRAMGDKSAAKDLMTAAGVPVVPGYHGEDQTLARLEHEAEGVGFPLLIKATQGGGGKGMRVVTGRAGFREGLEGAVREAVASFGNGRVLLERYIQRPRHVEVQVFADKRGGAVHLYERDCSVQRRHQKILEEAPVPGLEEAVRARLGRAAVDATRAVAYESAGTVEFIFDCDSGEFFFMEMNTCLQVEHPVTEMVVGQDLVEWQIRVARGEPLPLTQDQIQCRGHAFEARVYAESVPQGFLPSSGPLLHYRPPPPGAPGGGEVVRVESGVRRGDAISTFYDPLIAKLVVWGEDRGAALRRLRGSLAAYQVAGMPTNLPLLGAIAAHPGFAGAENLDTHFIARFRADLLPSAGATGEQSPGAGEADSAGPAPTDAAVEAARTGAVAAAASKCLVDRWLQQRGGVAQGEQGTGGGSGRAGGNTADPWHQGNGFRLNYTYKRPFALAPGEDGDPRLIGVPPVLLQIEYQKSGSFRAQVEGAKKGTARGETEAQSWAQVSGTVLSCDAVQAAPMPGAPAGDPPLTAVSADLDLCLGETRMSASYCEFVKGETAHVHLWLGSGPDAIHSHFTFPAPTFAPPDLDHPENATASLASRVAHLGPGAVVAPMAGRVIRVCCGEAGATVRRGDPAVILESMKMEHTVRAPCTGKVVEVCVQAGQQVSDGAMLVALEPQKEDAE